MRELLNTGIRNARNVDRYIFAVGAIKELESILSDRRVSVDSYVIFLVDEYFKNNPDRLGELPRLKSDQLFYVSTAEEPTTQFTDDLAREISIRDQRQPCAIVGIGGGSTLDTAKAISNLITNGGSAADYQGWDLVTAPGIYKIGVPTLSGTGAEATRTCVMTNKINGLKMGMNSDHSVFDQLILDPNLTASVPRDQYFYTGMDAFIHCIEALNGIYRNPIGDAFSIQVINLCREIFNHDEMMSSQNRAKLMVASYLGGCAIATSYVGVVHPFSAGLSVVLGFPHCIANCITMKAMEEFYPAEHAEFMKFVEKQGINLPQKVCRNLSNDDHSALYRATIVHEKPLINALGLEFKTILSESKVKQLFGKM